MINLLLALCPFLQDTVERFDPVVPENVHAIVEEGFFLVDEQIIESDNSLADAYAYVDATLPPDRAVVLGIVGKAGHMGVGAAYSTWSPFLLKDKEGIIDVKVIGLSSDAEVGPLFLGEQYFPVKNAHFFNIGIRGQVDTFGVRQAGYAENIVFDNFWVYEPEEVDPLFIYGSAIYLSKDWKNLTLKRYQPRGLVVREHCFYLKPGGRTQILDCELWGGDRTGFQMRPHQAPTLTPYPHGDILIDGNYADSFGWNHAVKDGGGWITVWTSLENNVSIRNNTCINARYGCLVISQGPPQSDPYLTVDDFSHSNIWITNNIFENLNGDRNCVSIAATRKFYLGEYNQFISNKKPMTVNSDWSFKYTDALPVKEWFIDGRKAFPKWLTYEYNYATEQYDLLSIDDLKEKLL